MKILDQNNNPITDVSTLPDVEAAIAGATGPATHGKNGVPELPAIMGTTSADDVAVERARISAALSAANPSAAFEDDLPAAGEKRLRCHCVATSVSIFIPAGHVEVR
jgi:hypothetical protein